MRGVLAYRAFSFTPQPDRLNRLAERAGVSDKGTGRIFMRDTDVSGLASAMAPATRPGAAGQSHAHQPDGHSAGLCQRQRLHRSLPPAQGTDSAAGSGRHSRADLCHQGIKGKLSQIGHGIGHHGPGGLLLLLVDLLLQTRQIQFGSGGIIGHDRQAQGAQYQGSDQALHIRFSGVSRYDSLTIPILMPQSQHIDIYIFYL
jgi:hypothetical protein